MMFAPSALQSITLQSPNYQESITFYVEQFGLKIASSTSEATVFATDEQPRVLTLLSGPNPKLVAMNFTFAQRNAFKEAQEFHKLASRLTFSDEDRFVLVDPQGVELSFTVDKACLPVLTSSNAAYEPKFFSHIVLNSRTPEAYIQFYNEAIGLSVSDRYEKGFLTFLRANQPQHHCVGIALGDVDGLNHFAIDCGTIDGVMHSVGRLKGGGQDPIWGPGRHGPGGNVFAYFEDPNGFVAELTCEVLQIDEHVQHTPKEWKRTPLNGNVWGTGGPSARAVDLLAGRQPTAPA
jgi:catechol 2,3-dioxygenase-like lactoylglutathione lyase family enzyme